MKTIFPSLFSFIVCCSYLFGQHSDSDKIHLRYTVSPIQLVHPNTPTFKSGLEAEMGRITLWYEHGIRIPVLDLVWDGFAKENISDLSYWKGQGGVRLFLNDFSGLKIFVGIHGFHSPKSYSRVSDWYKPSSSGDHLYYEQADIRITRSGARGEVGFRYQRNRLGVDLSCSLGILQRIVRYNNIVNETLVPDVHDDFLILRPDRRPGTEVLPTAIASLRFHYLIF
ncbi:MAG: hypothetical protein AAF587_00745 [Bacteroidota bacterium]